jgi:hypothetical protein
LAKTRHWADVVIDVTEIIGIGATLITTRFVIQTI